MDPFPRWMKKVFNWQPYLKVHLQSADSIMQFLFHPDEHHIKESTELYGFRFDLCRKVLCIKHRGCCLFCYAGPAPCRLCIVECSSRRPCLASLVLLVVNTEARAPVPEHRHFSPPLPSRRQLLSSVVGSETEPNWSLSHF